MSFLQAIILGVIEGLSEFLPISSTGHLMIGAELLRLPGSDFVKSFEIAIQLGAILAVVVLYPRRLFNDWSTIKKLATAFLPTAILGAVFYKIVKAVLLSSTTTVLWALFIGGAAIIIFEWWYGRRAIVAPPSENVSYQQAFVIGCVQALAMIPGVSRSAATIVGGLALGLSRRAIVEFSFLLAVPTILAATALDLYKSAGLFVGTDRVVLGVGGAVAFLVALIAIRFFLAFVKKYSFSAFGVYRIIAALIFALLIAG